MNNIQIKTLTPVHIGSGKTLLHGNDFVYGKFADDNSPAIGIINPMEVLKLIGEENIDKWMTSIERKERIDHLVSVYAPNATIEDYSLRVICKDFGKEAETLKEQLHDGNGRPYIPGSSLKGAIRSAVLATMTTTDNKLWENKIRKGTKVSASEVESQLFGKDLKESIFRFLQVGDAYFGEVYETAIRMINLNERQNKSFRDESKPQIIEAIGVGDESTFQMKVNTRLYNVAKGKITEMPTCMSSVEELLKTINEHTSKLLTQEIEYWKQRSNKDQGNMVDKYVLKLTWIKNEAGKCEAGKSCILRVGHGSGWRFITGAWTEGFDNFKQDVVQAARPGNYKYESYDFPKTRRINDQCELLGFVKLTVI